MNDPNWMDMPGVRKSEDFGDPLFRLLDTMGRRKEHLPKPIPWVEPSINMPYLQACQSYLFQSPLPSILATGSVLEHTLRLAIIDRYGGKQGAMDRKLWDHLKLMSIGNFLRGPNDKCGGNFDPVLASHVGSIIDNSDREWWRDTAKHLRDKAAHIDIPALISDIGRREDFVGEYKDSDDPNLIYGSRFWWGAPFHSSDELVAGEFLNQATEKLNRLIAKMEWKPDLSSWASQEYEYRTFFEYPWDKKAMLESLNKTHSYWVRE
jgi:hypothetical protein